MGKTNRICSLSGCSTPIRNNGNNGARGYCQRHYRSLKAHGDPQAVDRRRTERPTACTFSDCGRKVYGHGLCAGHWRQQYDGRPLAPIAERAGWGSNRGRACIVDGCDGEQKARSLCDMHYRRLRKHGTTDDIETVRAERYINAYGYALVYMPDHPNSGSRGLILEHRLVVSRLIGRPLRPEENVHHKNGVRDDNRPENLELWSTSQPQGQRAGDLVAWAKEVLRLYGDWCGDLDTSPSRVPGGEPGRVGDGAS